GGAARGWLLRAVAAPGAPPRHARPEPAQPGQRRLAVAQHVRAGPRPAGRRLWLAATELVRRKRFSCRPATGHPHRRRTPGQLWPPAGLPGPAPATGGRTERAPGP